MALTWLASALRAAGLRVAEVPGWQTRARPGSFTPVGVMLDCRIDLEECTA